MRPRVGDTLSTHGTRRHRTAPHRTARLFFLRPRHYLRPLMSSSRPFAAWPLTAELVSSPSLFSLFSRSLCNRSCTLSSRSSALMWSSSSSSSLLLLLLLLLLSSLAGLSAASLWSDSESLLVRLAVGVRRLSSSRPRGEARGSLSV